MINSGCSKKYNVLIRTFNILTKTLLHRIKRKIYLTWSQNKNLTMAWVPVNKDFQVLALPWCKIDKKYKKYNMKCGWSQLNQNLMYMYSEWSE